MKDIEDRIDALLSAATQNDIKVEVREVVDCALTVLHNFVDKYPTQESYLVSIIMSFIGTLHYGTKHPDLINSDPETIKKETGADEVFRKEEEIKA